MKEEAIVWLVGGKKNLRDTPGSPLKSRILEDVKIRMISQGCF